MTTKGILALGIVLTLIAAIISYAASYFFLMTNVQIFGLTLFIGLVAQLFIGVWIESHIKRG